MAVGAPSRFLLPSQIERLLSILSKRYAAEGRKTELRIIVNGSVRVVEGWSHDNWDGGIDGHAVYFRLPQDLYVESLQQHEALRQTIAEDLNRLKDVPNEFLEAVFFELDGDFDEDWRTASGVSVPRPRIVPQSAASRIWTVGYRIFLSHKSEMKGETAALKAALSVYGISAFVAHEDVHPTTEWQTEIENALATMDALVALMTPDFHESLWTDQEVGFAFGRGVPILSVRLGRDPYGFIGKFQALRCDWATAPHEIARVLIKRGGSIVDAYAAAMRNCQHFSDANQLARLLAELPTLSSAQVASLLESYRSNPEIWGSFGFNGRKPTQYGAGLAARLSVLTGTPYVNGVAGEITLA